MSKIGLELVKIYMRKDGVAKKVGRARLGARLGVRLSAAASPNPLE